MKNQTVIQYNYVILYTAMTTKRTKGVIKSLMTRKMFLKQKIVRIRIKSALIETNKN